MDDDLKYQEALYRYSLEIQEYPLHTALESLIIATQEYAQSLYTNGRFIESCDMFKKVITLQDELMESFIRGC